MKIYLLFISLCFSFSVFSQGGKYYDSLLQAKTKELGITEMISTVHNVDTSYVCEIKKFDKNGEVIEKLVPSYDNRFTRQRSKYDSLGRRIYFAIYNKLDTTEIQSIRNWTFIDSFHYRTELFNANREMTKIEEVEFVKKGDAVWIYKTETNPRSSRKEKKLSVYTTYGDSMFITAHVKYDRDNLMDDVTSSYQLTKVDSTRKQKIHTSGTCHAITEELEDLWLDQERLKEFYENKEKYLLKVLNGEYPYELDRDYQSYKVYNFKGRLIEDRLGYSEKTIYQYNEQNQLIKLTRYKTDLYSKNREAVATDESTFEYYTSGLRKSITTLNLKRDQSETLTFEYL